MQRIIALGSGQIAIHLGLSISSHSLQSAGLITNVVASILIAPAGQTVSQA